jgi:hypothetical protein
MAWNATSGIAPIGTPGLAGVQRGRHGVSDTGDRRHIRKHVHPFHAIRPSLGIDMRRMDNDVRFSSIDQRMRLFLQFFHQLADGRK